MNGKAQAQHQPEASTSSALPPPPNDPTNPALAKRPRVSGPRPSTFKPDSIPPQRPKQPVTFSPFNTFAPTPSTSTPKRPMSALMPLPPPLSVAPLAIAAAKPSRLPVSGRAEVKGKGKGKAPFSSVLGQKPPTPSVPPHKKPRLLQPFDTFAPESPITSKKKPNLQPLPSFALPATTSTPKRKPLATPPRPPSLLRANESVRPVGTPVSERASTLFGSLMVKKEEPVGKRLLESVPPAPKGGTDWDMLDDEGGAMQWSPRKKNAKYTLGGLASRTSSLIASARTDQTLWLHNLSRLLATHQQSSSPPLSKALLAKVAQPAVRFLVLETLPLRTTPPGTVRYRDASKTVLTRCRLLLDPTEKAADAPSSSPSQPSSAESELPPDEEYLTGLVLFSLHLHPPSASLHPSAALPRKKPVADGGAASLFLPTNPHDLRFIAAGAEVWVWEEGMEEVSLPFQGPRRLLPPMREERASRVHAEEGEEGEVYWDSRPVEELERERAEKRRKEEEEDGRKKALVCERFGVVG